jgi:epsilon-lactone hydrolase
VAVTAIALQPAAELRVAAMPGETPPWQRWWQQSRALGFWMIASRIAAFRLARAIRIADPAVRAARYAALRHWAERAEREGMAAMATAVRDLAVERPLAIGPGVSRISGPDFRSDSILLYVPGGSFLVPRSPRFTALISQVARAAGTPVAICDYRLAPEHPCPAAIDDVEAAFVHLLGHGYAADRIILIGESTGGGLALAAAQRLVARGLTPGGLALLSPWVDFDPARADIDPLTRMCATLWLNGARPADPGNNPGRAALRGLPPIMIHASRGDPLFVDAQMLAERAAFAGVPAELRHWPGRLHVLERFDNADTRRSIAEIAAFIARRLAARRAG